MITGKKRLWCFALGIALLTISHGLLAVALTWDQAKVPNEQQNTATAYTTSAIITNNPEAIEAQAKQLEDVAQRLRHYAEEIRQGRCLIPHDDRTGLSPTWRGGIHDI